MFKERTNKRRSNAVDTHAQSYTLDARHTRMIQEFASRQHQLDELQAQWTAVEPERHRWHAVIQSLKGPDGNGTGDAYDDAWRRNMDLCDQARNLKNTIERLQRSDDEIEYYQQTAKILYQYYDLLEDDQPTPESTRASIPPPTRILKGRKKHLPIPTRSIMDVLSQYAADPNGTANTNTDTNTNNIPDPNANATTHSGPVVNGVTLTQAPDAPDKQSLVDAYLNLVEPMYVRPMEHDPSICPKCLTPLMCMAGDGIVLCSDCGFQEWLLVEQNRPVLRQHQKEASHYSYKRINHFNEWVCQSQGKETTEIPEEVFERIVQEIQKEKITDTRKITYDKMHEILKRLKYNKFYEHIYYLLNRINGVATPHFPAELEEKLRNMFKEIQTPFVRHCPKERKNFLSYSYVLYKFLELLDKDEYLPFFPLLKSREKLHSQDQIWRKICQDLSWQFLSSI